MNNRTETRDLVDVTITLTKKCQKYIEDIKAITYLTNTGDTIIFCIAYIINMIEEEKERKEDSVLRAILDYCYGKELKALAKEYGLSGKRNQKKMAQNKDGANADYYGKKDDVKSQKFRIGRLLYGRAHDICDRIKEDYNKENTVSMAEFFIACIYYCGQHQYEFKQTTCDEMILYSGMKRKTILSLGLYWNVLFGSIVDKK